LSSAPGAPTRALAAPRARRPAPQSAAVWSKRPAAASGSSGSFTLVQRIQAAGGLLRTNIPMRHTVMRIALTNKKQVRARAPGFRVQPSGLAPQRAAPVERAAPVRAWQGHAPPPAT
jgi:hypothetical protein